MNSLYHATKFGLDGFSESLWYELAPFGIRVKVVAPGGVATNFGTRSLKMTLDPTDDHNPYAGQVRSVLATFNERGGAASSPEQTAEVLFTAATDDTSQLRYIAGDGAKGILGAKAQMSEADFAARIQKDFGL